MAKKHNNPPASTPAANAQAPAADAAPTADAQTPAAADPPPPAPPKAALVEARLLVDCPHGKINQVVKLSAEDAASGLKDGWADPGKEAVAAAKREAK